MMSFPLAAVCVAVSLVQPELPESDHETLIRGPVHEAFASPVLFDPAPAPTVRVEPPGEVEEVPPDEQPDGALWIPGYWSFDEELGQHLWVSGVWRVPPPGQRWVPGYWRRNADGFVWVNGFWAADATREMEEYYPPPPRSLEAGPSSPAPAATYTWVPGCWRFTDGRFLWRPGYWIAPRPDWVWVPSHHVWTPAGYVFVGGYWDYVPAARGVVFAPVFFRPAFFARPRLVFLPRMVIAHEVIVTHSFCRPSRRHYYFGDYYAASYVSYGYYPAFSFHYSRYGYDPVHVHHVAVMKSKDVHFESRMKDRYKELRDKSDLRPPRKLTSTQDGGAFVKPYQEIASRKGGPLTFGKPSYGRDRVARFTKDVKRQSGDRQRIEQQPFAPRGDGTAVQRREFPRSDGPRVEPRRPAPEIPERPKPDPRRAPLGPGVAPPRPDPGRDLRSPPAPPPASPDKKSGGGKGKGAGGKGDKGGG